MTLDSADIERIVREVVRRLDAGSPPASRTTITASPEATPPPPAPGTLSLAEPVVSLAVLNGRLAGLRQLVVSPHSVVTPAVRDELRARGVELVRQPLAPAAAVRLALGAEQAGQPAAAWTGWNGNRWTVTCCEQGPLDRVLDCLAEALGSQADAAVCLTPRPKVAVYLACRRHGLRAAEADSPAATRAAVEQLGAQLLAVDPHGCGPFQVKNLIAELAAAGPPSPPDELTSWTADPGQSGAAGSN